MAASSSEVGQDGYMQVERVRPALRERLGYRGTADLVDFRGHCREEWQADVVGVVGDRFERRLVEESSKLHVEMAQGFATVRGDLADQRSEILKWMFLFWIGQFFALASVVAVVIRFFRVS
jgi:hypothetical protein